MLVTFSSRQFGDDVCYFDVDDVDVGDVFWTGAFDSSVTNIDVIILCPELDL